MQLARQRHSAALILCASAFLFWATPAADAQADAYTSAALPDSGKILVIVRENTKPGKDGLVHEKTESQYAAAMRAARSSDYYTGMVSMTGVPRALFISDYSSLADLEAKRATLPAATNAALDRINETDGSTLDSSTISYFERRDNLSTNIKSAPGSAHYMDIMRFEVKPGHEYEFEEAAKLYMKDMLAAAPAMHWTCYSSIYGHSQGTVYIFMTALKSLAEADAELAASRAFGKATSPKDLKYLSDTLASTLISNEDNLLHIRPAFSYPSPDQVSADPGFWKPTAAPTAKKATVAKPATP